MSRNREIRQLRARLEERCRFIADTLRFRKLVTEQEINDYWPGGDENTDESVEGWIYCFATYTRFCDRIPLEGDNSRDAADDSVLDESLLDAPEVVELPDGRQFAVYPKSYHAIRVVESCDRRIAWLNARRQELIGGTSALELDTIERLEVEAENLYGMMAWAATHQSVGLPFDDDVAVIGIPEEIKQLNTMDVALLRNAYLRVNMLRLALLLKMLSSTTGAEPSSRDSWGGFFATQEIEGHGPAKHLMRDRSLVSQVAAALKVGQARRIAEERSKQQSNVA